jgi:phage internal scaffolding protein
MTDKKVIKFRKAYDKHKRYGFSTIGESLTEQSYAHDAKIQNIIKSYDSRGFFDTINRNPDQYGDFTQVTDLHTAMNKIQDAKDNFMTLPSRIREKFQNDPRSFYEFASKEENFEELVDMGIATEKVPVETPKESSPVVEEKASPSVPSESSGDA